MYRVHSTLRLLCPAAAALLVAASAGNASAALLVYEGFDYPDGTSIRGATGGFGWSGAWTNTGNATEIATAPGLNYGSLVVSGNKVTASGQQTTAANGNNAFIFRDLSTTFGADGTTLWLSFLGQRTGEKSMGGTAQPLNYQRVFSLGLFEGGTEQASIGELSADPADVWNLNRDTTVANSQPTTAPIDIQALLLLRIDYGAGNSDNAYLWVNPNISLGEPDIATADASITADNLTFNRIRLTVGGSQNSGATLAASGFFDEIRVGDTFADVAPIPEPASAALLAAAGFVLLLARRRPL